jgi:plasmid stabilization system protein ParE
MNLKRTKQYVSELQSILKYIHKDKPSAAKKFQEELDKHLLVVLENPYMHRASLYADDDSVRDLIFKGYTVVYQVGENMIVILDIFKWIDKTVVNTTDN